jgi:thioredoxin-dependent peroxiredoxin
MAKQELKPGDRAPDFDLPADGERRISLSGLKGKSVVLYF